jgi:hypothetical protein
MVDMYAVPTPTTVQAQWVSVVDPSGGQMQTANLHPYDATRDVCGQGSDIKPETVTTIGVKIKFRVTDTIPDGQRIGLELMLTVSDSETQFIPDTFYCQGIVIDSATVIPADDWAEHIFWFFGFPTQQQYLRFLLARRANPWSGDLMSPAANPNVGLLVSDLIILPRDPSDAPHTVFGWGTEFGETFGLTS